MRNRKAVPCKSTGVSEKQRSADDAATPVSDRDKGILHEDQPESVLAPERNDSIPADEGIGQMAPSAETR